MENTDALRRDLQTVIADRARHYMVSNGHLYEYSVRPLYFGSNKNGTLLGFVISGYAVDHRFLLEVGRGAGAEAAFIAGNEIAVSTLPKEMQEALRGQVGSLDENGEEIIQVGRERLPGRQQRSDERGSSSASAGGDEVLQRSGPCRAGD